MTRALEASPGEPLVMSCHVIRGRHDETSNLMALQLNYFITGCCALDHTLRHRRQKRVATIPSKRQSTNDYLPQYVRYVQNVTNRLMDGRRTEQGKKGTR